MKRILITAVLLGLGGGAYAMDFNELAGVNAAGLKAIAAADSLVVPEVNKGYVKPLKPATPIKWVAIPGGKFTMGTNSGEQGFEDASPAHEVTIEAFELSKTAVTVEQYAECVNKGFCSEPITAAYCNWGKPGRELHPLNCVDWDQANEYALFNDARLPSESEWEYAARSGGRNQKYPWGDDEPTSELAVFKTDSTMPVCSKPKGNTAQGLCDMSGNVWQWVGDTYQDSYKGAPVDGSAVRGRGRRVIRGGCFENIASPLRAGSRNRKLSSYRFGLIGFRLAR